MRNSKTKTMILNAILLGIGFIAHQIFPAIAGGITPDITLVMLFCIMIINKDDYKTCLVAGIISGIFSALATKFPSGQVPNMVDKLVTVNVMYILLKTMYAIPFINKFNEKKDQFIIFLITFIGTFVSGLVFLTTAAAMVGLPASLTSLIIAVVLPSIALNVIASIVLFNIIKMALKRSNYQIG
nr:tryptophan transporter [uncultured Peptostreptococcus sp.]